MKENLKAIRKVIDLLQEYRPNYSDYALEALRDLEALVLEDETLMLQDETKRDNDLIGEDYLD